MRGKVSHKTISRYAWRITPAHAGKRRNHLYSKSFCKDHPRTCGEKLERDVYKAFEDGSPPHMRGKVYKF